MKYKFISFLSDVRYLRLRPFISLIFGLFAHVFYAIGVKSIARNLCAASLRYGFKARNAALYKKLLQAAPYDISNATGDVTLRETIIRSIIIQWPEYDDSGCKKGILIITYTRTTAFYIKNVNIKELEKHFHIILEPSSSGYADPDIFWFQGKFNNLIVCASELEDRALLNCFPDTFIAVSFGAGDWVNCRDFRDTQQEKIYDSIYIANTKPLKRIKRYLDAVSNIVKAGNTNYVGCLVCAAWGGAEQLVKSLVASYGLEKNIVLKMSLTRQEVIEQLNKSKVNMLLSYKEGSSRSLFESMFCNVPVICISENIGVNKSYINEYTGLLVPDNFLESALEWFVHAYRNFNPREWALKNISPAASCEKLAEVIRLRKNNSAQYSYPIYLKANDPEVGYFDAPDLDHKPYTERVINLFALSSNSNEQTAREVLQQLSSEFRTQISANHISEKNMRSSS